MPKSNAQYQREFRERKRGKTEEEKKAYLKKNAEDIKRWRQAKKQQKEEIQKVKVIEEAKRLGLVDTDAEIIDESKHTDREKKRGRPTEFSLEVEASTRPVLDKKEEKTEKKHKPLKTKILAESTIKNYMNGLNHIVKLYNFEMPNDVEKEVEKLLKNEKGKKLKIIKNYFQFLENDPKDVLKRINEQTRVQPASLIKAATTFASRLAPFKNAYNIFSEANVMEIYKSQEKRDENEVKEDDKEKIIDLSYQTAKDNLLKLEDDEKLIYALYTLNPPRRLMDYHLLGKKGSANFLIKDANGKVKSFHFGKYKTKKYYGNQEVEIHPELAYVIEEYMQTHDSFPKITNATVNKVFKKLYDIDKISINFIRISYLTGLNKNGELSKMTEKERKELARKMGHTRKQQNEYIKQVV